LTAEGTTSKGTGSISCEVEFCIFYRLSLRTLRTKDVFVNKPLRSRKTDSKNGSYYGGLKWGATSL
jgi:hypothetical protein